MSPVRLDDAPAAVAVEMVAHVAALKARLRHAFPEIEHQGSIAQQMLASAWLELGVEALARRSDAGAVFDHVLAVLEGHTAEAATFPCLCVVGGGVNPECQLHGRCGRWQ